MVCTDTESLICTANIKKLYERGKVMTAITTAVGEVMTLVESMLTSITGNAILVVVLASGFVRLALSVLRRLFRTSRSL